ncbi:MAG: hypothetical protein PF444_07550, partial [Bacteroidales bacterium]|nr:hypothetical protein [Bacteroidales bacterium]
MRKKLSYLVLILISLTLQLSAMTLELPYSVTDSITNPSFEDGLNGWINPNGFVTQTNNAFAQKEGVNYVEKWQASGSWANVKLSQTLTNMPIGYYKLSAAAINNPTTTGGAYIYANDSSTEVFENIDYDVYFQTSNDSIEIGFNVISGGNYIGTDNYRLVYLGADDYKAYLRMYVESAQTMITNPVAISDSTLYTNLQLYVDSTQAVIDNANATLDEVIESEGQLKAAIALVSAAMQLPNRIASWTALPYDA